MTIDVILLIAVLALLMAIGALVVALVALKQSQSARVQPRRTHVARYFGV